MGSADGLTSKFLSASADYRMLQKGDKVLAALSGGADSTALAVLLKEHSEELGISVCAAHLNHCLRGEESDRDEEHVRDFCENFGIPLVAEKIDVAKTAAECGCGIEDAARRIRYGFLERTADSLGCTKIATAHNLNDNAETVIMNLIRGTGLRGLAGIPPVRGRIVRPLLFCTREDIEGFLRERNIDFVTDRTNLDTTYTRNKIRHRIIPLLCEINPLFVENMAEFTKLLRSDADYLDSAVDSVHVGVSDEVCISRELLAGLPVGIAGRTVKRMYETAYRKLHGTDAEGIAGSSPDLSLKHTMAVIRLAAGGSASGEVHLPGGVTARCRYGQLLLKGDNENRGKGRVYVADNKPGVEGEKPLKLGQNRFGSWVITAEISDTADHKSGYIKSQTRKRVTASDIKGAGTNIDFGGPYTLDIYNGQMSNIVNTVFLDPRLIDSGLIIRGYKTGDSISPVGRDWTKTLKKLYIEMKIPKQDRALRPVIATGTGVCAIPGYMADKKFAAGSPPALKLTFRLEKGYDAANE